MYEITVKTPVKPMFSGGPAPADAGPPVNQRPAKFCKSGGNSTAPAAPALHRRRTDIKRYSTDIAAKLFQSFAIVAGER